MNANKPINIPASASMEILKRGGQPTIAQRFSSFFTWQTVAIIIFIIILCLYAYYTYKQYAKNRKTRKMCKRKRS